MTNTAVPSPPQPDAGTARRRCPDDLWVLGELGGGAGRGGGGGGGIFARVSA